MRKFTIFKDSYGKVCIEGPHIRTSEIVEVLEYTEVVKLLYNISIKSSQSTSIWWLVKYKLKKFLKIKE